MQFQIGILCGLAMLVAGPAALPQTPPLVPYTALLARARAGEKVDFTALRMACAVPDGCGLETDGQEHIAQAKTPEALLRAAQAVLDKSYVDADAQIAAAYAYAKLGDKKKSELHGNIARGLLESILHSGNGRTAKTAFRVIAVYEEYEVMRALRMMPSEQSELQQGGHWYDQMTLTDPTTGKKVTLFFNVDIVHANEMRAVGGN